MLLFMPLPFIRGFGIAGLAGAFAVTRIIGTLLYNVTPTDPVSFGLVALVLTLIAAAASYLPARRASRATTCPGERWS